MASIGQGKVGRRRSVLYAYLCLVGKRRSEIGRRKRMVVRVVAGAVQPLGAGGRAAGLFGGGEQPGSEAGS